MNKGFETPEECFTYLFCVKRDLQRTPVFRDGELCTFLGSNLGDYGKLLAIAVTVGFIWFIAILVDPEQFQHMVLIASLFTAAIVFILAMMIPLSIKKQKQLSTTPPTLQYCSTNDCFESPRHQWSTANNIELVLISAKTTDKVGPSYNQTVYQYHFVTLKQGERYFPVSLSRSVGLAQLGGDPLADFCRYHSIKYKQERYDFTGLISNEDRIETLGRI